MKIKSLVLLSNDLQETKAFYTRRLNLQLITEERDCIVLGAGSSSILFKQSPIPEPVYHFAFNISNNKIEDALSWCEKKQLHILCYRQNTKLIDFPNWNAKSIYFLDNNGNILEFIARFDLNTETDLAFDEKQILSVSEIGMVVDNVPEFCKNTMQEYGIPFYVKQKPASDFSVMGDANGLLIIVPEDRKWFPTEIPAGKVPVEILLEQNGIQHKITQG
jgi:catechol 2,3-dioxygenase-like lactoylglutathione lyase family enzyme